VSSAGWGSSLMRRIRLVQVRSWFMCVACAGNCDQPACMTSPVCLQCPAGFKFDLDTLVCVENC
jgi:hypothetical protein